MSLASPGFRSNSGAGVKQKVAVPPEPGISRISTGSTVSRVKVPTPPVHHRLARHQIRADELLGHIGSNRITSTDMGLLPAHANAHVINIVGRIYLSSRSEYRPLADADYYARLVGRIAHKKDYNCYDDKSSPSHSGYSPPSDTPMNTRLNSSQSSLNSPPGIVFPSGVLLRPCGFTRVTPFSSAAITANSCDFGT